MIVPQPEVSTLQAGWTSLPNGSLLRQVTKFRQHDVDVGYIFYRHDSTNTDALSDSFTFEVQ